MPTVLDQSQIIEPTLELCSQLLNEVIKSGEKNSAIGCSKRAIDTLNSLEASEKTIEVSDNLMVFNYLKNQISHLRYVQNCLLNKYCF